MSSLLLAIPHRTEAFAGACLPACLQMALAYFGVNRSQEQIASQIGHIAGAGTPARYVTRLVVPGIEISYTAKGSLEGIGRCLDRKQISILFVRTGELPYWEDDTAHAVLVVGMDQTTIWVHDPAFDKAPIPVPIDDLSLAWYEMGNAWAQVAGQSA